MNETETYIFDMVTKRKGYPISKENIITKYYRQDNFIICVVNNREEETIGIAKRHPRDRYDFNIGWKIAFNRAVRNLIELEMPRMKVTKYVLAKKLEENNFSPFI